jgi:glucokinase
MKTNMRLILAGDIGATKTVLALYDAAAFPRPPLRQRTFQNVQFSSFDDLLLEFIDQGVPYPACGSFGVAGPIMDHTVKMTNLNWSIDAAALQARHGFEEVHLINDLVATAMGALYLQETDLHPLNPGLPKNEAVMAVLAPGSGLGEAFLVPYNGAYHPFPSEGGHASFAPRNAEQIDLLTFLLKRQDHVSVEQVCSGLAIPGLFAFMATRHPTPDWLTAELNQAPDRTPVIVQAAVQAMRGGKACDIAVRTLTLFTEILADEAANLALKTLAFGGLFLGGGLAPRLLPFLTTERFMTVFARGGYRDWLSRIPIHIICNPHAALLGAAAYGSIAQGNKSEPTSQQ